MKTFQHLNSISTSTNNRKKREREGGYRNRKGRYNTTQAKEGELRAEGAKN